MSSQVDQFVDLLQKYPSNGLFSNPWADWDRDFDTDEHAPHHRSNQLRAYLNARLDTAKALLIAEASGYQGAKFSGIPMTCEQTLLGHRGVSCADVFDETIKPQRTSCPEASSKQAVKRGGFREPTAGYVWRGMADRPGLSKKIVLWNLFAFHPHKDADTLTNRTPTKTEILNNRPVLDAFLRLFPDRPILSIGKKSEEYLTRWEYRIEISFLLHGTQRMEGALNFVRTFTNSWRQSDSWPDYGSMIGST
jgi:hypothetical protein